MHSAVLPEAVDLGTETAQTHSPSFGLDDEKTEPMGRSCLLARRLVEREAPFVRVYADREAAGTPTRKSKRITAIFAAPATS